MDLRTLAEQVRKNPTKFAFVVGAGVSMQASNGSYVAGWKGLLESGLDSVGEKKSARWKKVYSALLKLSDIEAMLAVGQAIESSVDWSPSLRQTVKTQFLSNGELSHGIVTQAVHAGV